MIVTIVEADVAPDREDALRAAWAEETARPTPPGLVRSYLLHTADGPWRIVTVWESREALDAMRAAGRPAALTMVEAAGATGTVSVWDVAGHLDAT